nr:hypothetical protein [uncultured Oscillibacter sp.]
MAEGQGQQTAGGRGEPLGYIYKAVSKSVREVLRTLKITDSHGNPVDRAKCWAAIGTQKLVE